MGLKIAIFCALLSWLSLPLAAKHIKVAVSAVTSIAKTDDLYLCATLDWWPSDKCDYNQCPWGQAGIPYLDLSNNIMQNAIKAFNPLRLRVGGSLQDQVLYNTGTAIKECPAFKKQQDGLFGFSTGCLEMDRWDELNDFFNKTGAKVTFGLNALMGKKKDQKDETLWVGGWDSRNANDLMRYTVSKGYGHVDSYELGNELCASGVSARLEAKEYAKDMLELKRIVKEIYQDAGQQPKILGPAGFYDEKWFSEFLLATGPDVVDGVTHHMYNLGAGVDETLIDKIQDPLFLDQVAQTLKDVSDTVKQFGPWAGPWVGESGGAYNSGSKDVSHTFANGFWYVDQLGMAATFNHKVYCRQALIGGNYALLNTTSFIPNPDYYSALLWHRLMGTRVLQVTHSGGPYLRVYSHCSRKGGITLVLINMSNSASYNVVVLEDYNIYGENAHLHGIHTDHYSGGEKKREEYHLTPQDGNIQSDVVLLNGTPLKLTDSGDIPSMEPKYVDPSLPIHLSPDSITFVTIGDFNAPACA